MYKHILIPTDGGELSEQAVTHGLELAKAFGSKVTTISVRMPLQVMAVEGVTIPIPEESRQEIIAQIQAQLDKVSRQAKAVGVSCTTMQVEASQPWDAIVAAAEEQGCDLIVMASHGRRGFSALLLGSETQKVLTHTKIPVLVYR